MLYFVSMTKTRKESDWIGTDRVLWRDWVRRWLFRLPWWLLRPSWFCSSRFRPLACGRCSCRWPFLRDTRRHVSRQRSPRKAPPHLSSPHKPCTRCRNQAVGENYVTLSLDYVTLLLSYCLIIVIIWQVALFHPNASHYDSIINTSQEGS